MNRHTLHRALWAGLILVGMMPMVLGLWSLIVPPSADVVFGFPAPVRAGETRAMVFTLTYPETLFIQYRAAKGDVRNEQRCEARPVLWWKEWACANARFIPSLRWEIREGGRVVAKGSRRGALASAQDDGAEAISFATGEIVPRGITRYQLRVTAENDLSGLGPRHPQIIVFSPPLLGENQAWLLFGAGVIVMFAIGVPLAAMAGNARRPKFRRR